MIYYAKQNSDLLKRMVLNGWVCLRYKELERRALEHRRPSRFGARSIQSQANVADDRIWLPRIISTDYQSDVVYNFLLEDDLLIDHQLRKTGDYRSSSVDINRQKLGSLDAHWYFGLFGISGGILKLARAI